MKGKGTITNKMHVPFEGGDAKVNEEKGEVWESRSGDVLRVGECASNAAGERKPCV